MSRRNVEAEQAVLGGIMLAPDAYWRVSGLLTADDFSLPAHKQIWQAIRECLQPSPGSDPTPIDPVTLGEWFEARGKSGVVQGGAYLIELFTQTPSAANIVAYAEIVAKRAEAERVQAAGRRIAACDNFADAQALLAEVRPQQTARVKSVKDGLSEMLEAAQLRSNGPYGLTWAIPGVDRVAGLLVPSRLYGIAARAKMGKTTTSLAPQIHAVLRNKRVLNYSLEMTAGELTQAGLALIGGFDSEIFEREEGVPDESWAYIHAAAQQIAGKPWLIDDRPGLTLAEIESTAMQHHMEQPLDLIVVDHIGLVRLPHRRNATKSDELGEVSYGLKNLAKRLRVPILALVQLNRNLETRADKRPITPDLRDSGNLEQDFDCVVSVYRDEVYNPQSPDVGHAEIDTMFNRHGRGGMAFVSVDMGTKRYGEPKHPRLAFPAGSNSGGSNGGGFKNFGAPRSQSSALSVAGRDD